MYSFNGKSQMLLISTKLNFRIVEKDRSVVVFLFPEKIISCACLVQSRINDIFHWYAQSCVFNRLLLRVEAEVFAQFAMLNKELPSTKSLTSEFSRSGRSFI